MKLMQSPAILIPLYAGILIQETESQVPIGLGYGHEYAKEMALTALNNVRNQLCTIIIFKKYVEIMHVKNH